MNFFNFLRPRLLVSNYGLYTTHAILASMPSWQACHLGKPVMELHDIGKDSMVTSMILIEFFALFVT